jgi:hypothetical protein
MIELETARQLLDFQGLARSISAEAAEEQLRGAVALHNILRTRRVAYLADEVGMGKTYVALGALALFRHFDPDFRLLVIAPRENIQRKWMKELRNFVRNNVRFADLRVKALHGAPARPAVACRNLVELVRETSHNPDRDFFARLTSFSLPLGSDSKALRKRRNELLRYLPWADREAFDLRSRDAFKDNFARAVCVALPVFDLVIVDEGHNLKHGFGKQVSARNRVLALALGHPSEHARGFPGYGPRARRVLFLSATPLESDYVQLWNQLDVLGFGEPASDLTAKDASEERKRACAQQFLIRRVTAMQVGDQRLTKNLYRREWRGGGVASHDLPLEAPEVDRDRQRLVVALVQKKVSEVLGHERFNNSFQIGMLASFESFLETAKVARRADGEDVSSFDDPDQTEDLDERSGIDVDAVNGLARSYRRSFGKELPHPKMDALVEHLAEGLPTGRKALVFVRRVASVKELQAKLEEKYDEQLMGRLRADLPSELLQPVQTAFRQYRSERTERRQRQVQELDSPGLEEEGPAGLIPEEADTGGLDSFFAWFFRGQGPQGMVSGAALQRRFSQASSAYSTFFEDNYLAWLLGARPSGVLAALSEALGMAPDRLSRELVNRAEPLLPSSREGKVGRLYLFVALQDAGLALLAEHPGPLQDRARIVRQTIEGPSGFKTTGARAPAEAHRWIEEPTFFSELRERHALRKRLWPEPDYGGDFRAAFREQELRRLLLSGMARLGHAFIDLWCVTVKSLGTLAARARVDEEEGTVGLIQAYLDDLERQRERLEFRAFGELSLAAEHFPLIVNVSDPDLWKASLADAAKTLSRTLLPRQRPIGGMWGELNQTLVRQFRLPGYPLALITTDLLQEGEDLHTFCSSVYHYGISWMPSSTEQRNGRIDRVNSETERRLKRANGGPGGDEKLQVYYPHLRETVERLQVDRVMERLNRFMRLMHRDLGQPDGERKQVSVYAEVHRLHRDIAPILEPLESAFPVREELLQAPPRPLAVEPDSTKRLLDRFHRVAGMPLAGLEIEWESDHPDDILMGTVRRSGGRQQPFTVALQSFGGRLMVRCFSPIGHLMLEDSDTASLAARVRARPVQIGAAWDDRFGCYDLNAEGEVLLGQESSDPDRLGWLIARVTETADDLEHELLGRDESLATFRDDLSREAPDVDA